MLVPADLLALELSQAMLGRDRAAESVERVVDDAAHLVAARDQRLRADVVVEVAVPYVTEAEDVDPSEPAAQVAPGKVDEFGNPRDRNRNVVLDVGELRLRNRLADAPQRARLLAALRDRGVAKCGLRGAIGEHVFDALAQRRRLSA